MSSKARKLATQVALGLGAGAAVSLTLALCSAHARAAELTMVEILKLADQHSPQLEAARFREAEAREAVGIARAGYMPQIDFQAIDSTGFPGSSGYLGIGGLMGSPYRSGAAYGVVARETLWDFGRTTNAVAAARGDIETRRQDTRVTRYQVAQAAVRAFVDCARFRNLVGVWTDLNRESHLVAREVDRFVRTGQRSVVEHLLVTAQEEEALTAMADYGERMKMAIRRISILTGLAEDKITCAELAPDREPAPGFGAPEASPLVRRAAADAEAARSRVSQARAGHWPKLVALASVGDMEKARLVGKQDYALAVGFSLPLFDGLRTTSEVARAEASASEKERELDAAGQRMAELNAAYDEALRSSEVRRKHLEHELELASRGLELARKRYFAQQGTLIDFRESLRNLSRIRSQLADSLAESLNAAWAKALANGAEL